MRGPHQFSIYPRIVVRLCRLVTILFYQICLGEILSSLLWFVDFVHMQHHIGVCILKTI